MISRNAVRLAACAVALGSLVPLGARAHAQGAPFTIRRPPDGATVREKVRVEIPHASIGDRSFVVVYLDGKFDVAIDPQRLQDSSVTGSVPAALRKEDRFFTFVWDTKAEGVSDGPHSVRVVLFDPVEGGPAGLSVTQRATSEVKLNVANKIKDGPSSLRLRYKYPEGKNIEYQRTAKTVRAGGDQQLHISADQELTAVNSRLLLGILSNDPSGLSLVRNKLTKLDVLTSGQEVSFPDKELSQSLYQELDSRGQVHYETATLAGLEFNAAGLPVDTTVELPVMPAAAVSVGQTWTSPEQRIDVPSLPPVLQPRVKLQSTLVDMEWEGNYRTAKIHQHADNVKLPGDMTVNGLPIMGAAVSYDRDIYIAYTSGTLIRMTRTLTVKGRTTVADQEASSGSAPSGGGLLGGGGNNRPPGVPGAFGPGGSGGPSSSFGPGGGPPGSPPGFGPGGPPNSGGKFGGNRPGGISPTGPGTGFGAGAGPGSSGGPGRGFSGGRGFGSPPGFGGGSGGGLTGQPDYPITIKAINDTQLLRITHA